MLSFFYSIYVYVCDAIDGPVVIGKILGKKLNNKGKTQQQQHH